VLHAQCHVRLGSPTLGELSGEMYLDKSTTTAWWIRLYEKDMRAASKTRRTAGRTDRMQPQTGRSLVDEDRTEAHRREKELIRI